MVTFLEKTLKNYDEAVEQFVNQLIEQERSSYRTDLKDFDTHAREIKDQSAKKLMNVKESFIRGYEYVLENGPKYLSIPKEKFELEPFRKENKTVTEKQLALLLKSGKPLQEMCGYTSDMMTGIYQMGLDLYRSKDFNLCTDIYTFMISLNPYICWFWQMLGKCFHMQERYLEALYAFEVAINCNIYNFEGYLDAVRCCVQAKEFNEAQRIIDYGINAINTSDHPQQFEELRTNLEKLNKQINDLIKEA